MHREGPALVDLRVTRRSETSVERGRVVGVVTVLGPSLTMKRYQTLSGSVFCSVACQKSQLSAPSPSWQQLTSVAAGFIVMIFWPPALTL